MNDLSSRQTWFLSCLGGRGSAHLSKTRSCDDTGSPANVSFPLSPHPPVSTSPC